MASLSRLLLAGKPVHAIVFVSPRSDPAIAGTRTSDFRLELAYFGIGHRDAQVHQSTAARPGHLLSGLLSGIDGVRACLHVLDGTARGEAPLDAWLVAGAALEARAHPLFHYDPEAGSTWARRLRFEENPEAEGDWPRSSFEYRRDGELSTAELGFTFADLALLDPHHRGHFLELPAGFPEDDLVPVDEHLAPGRADAEHEIPFVWAVAADGTLHRLTITRRLAAASRDRLGFWRTLQELAGIRNEHVRAAVERAERTAREEAAAERARLEEEHLRELAQARAEATERGLEGLASFLLGFDPTDLPSSREEHAGTLRPVPSLPGAQATVIDPGPRDAAGASGTGAGAASSADAGTSPASTMTAEPEEDAAAEAWIDSVLCTSCNDCMNINAKMFVYDANKQARIGDLRSGTYAQLVAAAEKCPARCIHPGEPFDPAEPDLPELRERAKAFH
jgi:ferredoxin